MERIFKTTRTISCNNSLLYGPQQLFNRITSINRGEAGQTVPAIGLPLVTIGQEYQLAQLI